MTVAGSRAQAVYNTHMSSRTISLHDDAYRRLLAAKRSPRESFTQVVMRAVWPERTLTGRELLELLRREGAHLSEKGLRAIETAKRRQGLPEDKWKAR